ncbi:adenylyl-sulfate kinase 3-like [Iris pallida]|uniref:Adenylyl-sulfate kinase n=1 Tax=Iris pallida TaxID=29817 RepID=A0AAX6HS66_IRIPA|nr:adenylyl-sulfate kinase 3-like [Iris pallida]
MAILEAIFPAGAASRSLRQETPAHRRRAAVALRFRRGSGSGSVRPIEARVRARVGATGKREFVEADPDVDCDCEVPVKDHPVMSTVGKSTNIVWHNCPVGKVERQNLLKQKGCVIWITGLSGSGKSTLACALSRELHSMGYLTFVLDGDNIRHGLNRDLSFQAEDRAENIRRIGEVAKLFADAGIICIASLISPYRRDRDACRALLPDSTFIEVFMDVPLQICESRDSKGLYKLARAGKIKGFTGIDDPYEPPLNCEIVIQPKEGECASPTAMAEQVILYLDLNGFLKA